MQDFSFAQPVNRPQHGGNIAWAASLAGCSPLDILDFSASINPLGPPKSAIAAIQASWDSLTHYPDPRYLHLRQVLAAHHQIDPGWVLPGNGSAELLTWASRELAELPSTALITPAFGDYYRALKSFGATLHPCPIALSYPLTASPGVVLTPCPTLSSLTNTAGLLLNNPHNPTGAMFSVEAIRPLLERFSLVVVDEAFMDFVLPDHQQSLIALITQYPNLVILRSLTKFYSLPGLRLGYAIAHPDRLQRWQEWRDPWSVNVLAEAAAIAVLQDIAFQQHTFDWLEQTRSPLYRQLANIPGLQPLPGVANYFLVQSDYPVLQLQQELLQQHKILIRDCTSFAELGDRYFRIAIRTALENDRLLKGLTQTLSTLSTLKG
ncbi:MAG: threonine-phosphate decarboxylase CobD [Timaviella obliquedivisa GSE-PSE-MK23-08B]|nr:threonine-phosphate decarboxylase CobD [Timaviella obliquedivisa GSE-PSE-MK23-08B]